MARRTTRPGPRRNSAPAWKKLLVILSAPVAMVLAIGVLHVDTWSSILYVIVLIAVAVAAVWGTAKALGVHLSLGSWD